MSRTTIANNALRHIKNSKTLTDVDTDTSIQATAIRAFLDGALSEMVRAFEWPPLKKTDALALVREGDPDDGDEWFYFYRWPSDCEKARYLVDGNMEPSRIYPRIPFEITSDDTGKLIATNEQDAILAYTREVDDDIDQMSEKFKRALEFKVAYLAAPTLGGDSSSAMMQYCYGQYELCFSQAKAEYLMERQRQNPRESEFIEGR